MQDFYDLLLTVYMYLNLIAKDTERNFLICAFLFKIVSLTYGTNVNVASLKSNNRLLSFSIGIDCNLFELTQLTLLNRTLFQPFLVKTW